jgi:uncharacterized protein YbaP (TraB family)
MTTSRRCVLVAPLALLLAIHPAGAQAPAAANASSQPAKTKPSRFLWEVKSKTATVYLLGSVHIASPSMYPLDPAIEQAFARADTLVLETPMDADAQQRAAALMQQAGMYTPPDSLDKHVDPKALASLEKAVGALGLPMLAVTSMRPWLVALTLTLLKLQTLGYRPELGIDQHFHAAAGKKRVAALETLEEQVALFRDMPEKIQAAALRQTLAQLDELPDLMRRAVDAWRRGDLAAFEKLLVEPTRKDYPELYRRLIVDRNRAMAAALGRYLAGNGTTFVVVGGGHLVGRDSIVRMLEAAGHKPTQL